MVIQMVEARNMSKIPVERERLDERLDVRLQMRLTAFVRLLGKILLSAERCFKRRLCASEEMVFKILVILG